MEARLPPARAFGDVLFEPLSGELRLDGQTRRLRPQTAAVLAHLLARPGELVSRDDLLTGVWGDVLVTENSLAQCIAEIRRALGADREAWLKTIARRGYRLEAPSPPPPDHRDESAAEEIPAAVEPVASVGGLAPAEAPGRRSRSMLGWVLAVAAVLATGYGLGWNGLHSGRPVAQISLAVLPFALVGSSSDAAWFAEVVGEDITFNLARIPGARVISRVSTQTYSPHGTDVQRVARELKVRYVLAGSVDRNADGVTMRLQLIEAATGAMRWSERIDTTSSALRDAERRVANRVANALHLQLIGEEATRVARADPVSPAAEDLALQGWAAWNRGTPSEVARARELAQRAIELNDRSVMAWKTLASWHLRARINQSLPAEQAEAGAEQAANRAMAIDPDHPLVHTVWGAAQVLRGRYAQGRKALEHEIRTNPSHPVAYSYLGMAHVMLGEPRLAIARYLEALDISPRDPRLSRFERHLALAYLHNGELDKAVAHARQAVSAPQVDRAAWAVLAGVCAAAYDAPCLEIARASLLRAWPDATVAAIESEWPPQTDAFRQQHAPFVQGLSRVLDLR